MNLAIRCVGPPRALGGIVQNGPCVSNHSTPTDSGGAWLQLFPILYLASGQLRIASQSHIRGVPLPPQMSAFLDHSSRTLREETDPAHTSLLTRSAGAWFVRSGGHHPTPFQYPLVIAFGLDGQTAVRQAIDQGENSTVCMEPPTGYYLAARELKESVRQAMSPGEDFGACRPYHEPH